MAIFDTRGGVTNDKLALARVLLGYASAWETQAKRLKILNSSSTIQCRQMTARWIFPAKTCPAILLETMTSLKEQLIREIEQTSETALAAVLAFLRSTRAQPQANPSTTWIETTPGVCGGKPRIAGHRIRVQDIAIWHEDLGLSPQEIVQQHPSITLAQVHAVLALSRASIGNSAANSSR